MDDYQILQAMRSEIQSEHTLLSHRMTWYVTSQSFLMTAYAIAWGKGHEIAWKAFFQNGIPLLGVLLSIGAWLGIFSAVWVQAHVIESQTALLEKMRKRFEDANDAQALATLNDYSGTTCAGRPSKTRFHWLAMMPPCMIPAVFLLTWIVAWIVSG